VTGVGDRGRGGAGDDARTNRDYWDGYSDRYQADHGEQLARPLAWGTWAIPDAEVGALGEVTGLDVLELGCGAAQWSIALADAGARVVGVDVSARQLAHATDLVASRPAPSAGSEAGSVVLVQGAGHAIPLADASVDLVLSDHGALSYVHPDDALPEVARVLRPGGRVLIDTFTPFTGVCWDEEEARWDDHLHQPYFGSDRWDDVGGFVSFELGYGAWIRAFGRHGFLVTDLHELRPPSDARSSHHDADSRRWARRWPAEHIWVARRR
jgi:SAM-dependent methyltransferase